jgi:hypothetical protein
VYAQLDAILPDQGIISISQITTRKSLAERERKNTSYRVYSPYIQTASILNKCWSICVPPLFWCSKLEGSARCVVLRWRRCSRGWTLLPAGSILYNEQTNNTQRSVFSIYFVPLPVWCSTLNKSAPCRVLGQWKHSRGRTLPPLGMTADAISWPILNPHILPSGTQPWRRQPYLRLALVYGCTILALCRYNVWRQVSDSGFKVRLGIRFHQVSAYASRKFTITNTVIISSSRYRFCSRSTDKTLKCQFPKEGTPDLWCISQTITHDHCYPYYYYYYHICYYLQAPFCIPVPPIRHWRVS